VVNNSEMNIGVQLSLQHTNFNSFVCVNNNEIARSYADLVLDFGDLVSDSVFQSG
jgi:hypothetical protein